MAVGEQTPLVNGAHVTETQAKRGPFLVKVAVGWLVLFAVVFGASRVLHDSDERSSSPAVVNAADTAFCDPAAKHDIGYLKLPNKVDAHYFYWYFESRSEAPDKDPFLLWLSGGGSSIFAALSENGPCTVRPDLSTQANPYSWNGNANVLWIDQPTGQGFSYGADVDTDRTTTDATENVYWFLQEFLSKKHPELLGRDFFVAGESYAGHYVPLVAHYIVEKNKEIDEIGDTSASNSSTNNVRINLQGIALGNGMVNPVIQVRLLASSLGTFG